MPSGARPHTLHVARLRMVGSLGVSYSDSKKHKHDDRSQASTDGMVCGDI